MAIEMEKKCKWCGAQFKQDVCHSCGAIQRIGNIKKEWKKTESVRDAGKKGKRSIGKN